MASLGNKRKAYICAVADDITSFENAIWLGGETANSLNRTQEAVECSDKSSDWAKFLSGKRGGTFEVTVYADNADEGQVLALNALHLGSKVKYAAGVELAGDWDANDYDCGTGVVTAVSDTNDFGAVASRQITMQADGYIDAAYLDEEEEAIEEPAVPADPDDPAEPADPAEEEQG